MAGATFESTTRQLQELWRVEKGYERGAHPGWLKMPDAEEKGWNFLTPGIRALVRAEYECNRYVKGERSKKLFGYPRLFDNMLSSQPMCFNLLGELALDVELATLVFRRLFPEQVDRVYEIRFEYSPGRRDPRYLTNRSAADALVIHTTPSGGRSFLAIETKYCEGMTASPGVWDASRYESVSTRAKAWKEGPPTAGRLLQITLDHLLALSMLQAKDGWESGLFMFVFPAPNLACANAARDYGATLSPVGAETFRAVTLEEIHAAIGASSKQPWVNDFNRRYLDFNRAT
jgi:hypothetical protein